MFKPISFFVCVVSMVVFVLLVGSASQIYAQGRSFTYKNLTLSLPDGWASQDITKNSEKELIGSFKSEKIVGTTVLVFCYTGWPYSNYSNVRIAGLKTIAASFPKGQEMLKRPTKMKTDGGYAAVIEFWKGAVDAGGQTVFLRSPMGIIKTKVGWIMMLGFTPDSTGDQLEEDFLKMIKSIQ
jgi:hypothetical protein